jgi:DNA invertase Pin-like site-specific DNA recombinase
MPQEPYSLKVVGYVRVSTAEQADSGAGSRRSAQRSRRKPSGGDGNSSAFSRMPEQVASP